MRKKAKKNDDYSVREYVKAHPRLAAVYFVLRLLVIAIMIAQIFNRNFENVMYCVLTLVLFMIPSFVERRIKIDVPDTLEVIILLFIFAAEILGEIREYYINVPIWDTMLHTTTGFLAAAIGIALIDILNRSPRFAFKMSPLFVSLVAFCFSMTIGVVWEFYEFGSDKLFNMDMQKDRIIQTVSTVELNPEGKNIPFVITDIDKTVIYGVHDGEPIEAVIDGYLDIGIIDTMKDLFVNFIGAVVFSTIGYVYIKKRGKGREGRFAKRFMLTMMNPPEVDSGFPDDISDNTMDDTTEHESPPALSGSDKHE